MRLILDLIRKTFFWSERDAIELELICSKKELRDAENNAEMATASISMLDSRMLRLREYGSLNQVAETREQLQSFHLLKEISMRDIAVMNQRIPRLEKLLARTSASIYVSALPSISGKEKLWTFKWMR